MGDEIKNKWLGKLKLINPNWKDGDLNNGNKTADLVNEKSRLAIELKNDTVFKLRFNTGNEVSLITLSNRYKGYGKDANSKFCFYPNCKTVLLIECGIFKGLLQSIFTGIETKRGRIGEWFLKNKNLWESYPNIGCYLINSKIKEDIVAEFYYFKNPVAEKNRILEKVEVEKALNIATFLLFEENL